MKKNFNKLIVLAVFILFSGVFSVNAAKKIDTNIKVITKDGQVYYGKGYPPASGSKKVIFWTNEGKRNKLKSEDISYLKVWHESKDSTSAYKFIYTPYRYYNNTINSNKGSKLINYKVWTVEIAQTAYLTVYEFSSLYRVGEDGLTFVSVQSVSSSGIASKPTPRYYLVQRLFENYPTMISMVQDEYRRNSNDIFRKSGPLYFKDSPVLGEKIKKEEFSNANFENALIFYDEYLYNLR